MITTQQDHFGTSKNQNNWAAYIDGKMLRGKNGVGRSFKTERAARKAAEKAAA